MTALLTCTINRTLTHWIQQRLQPAQPAAHWQLWCFEGWTARQAAQQQLATQGIQAHIRSCYKPLVHAFLEEIDTHQLATVHVHYPVHPHAAPNRFLLEAYPLAAMLPQLELHMHAGTSTSHYQLALHYTDGRVVHTDVFAPNRAFTTVQGQPGITPCGWETAQTDSGVLTTNTEIETDYEQAYHQAMQCIRQHSWPASEPFFGQLHIRMQLPGYEQAITGIDEVISTPEAMHEELYFSLLEHFQQHSGRAHGDRRLQPGQIVPDIRIAPQAQPLALQSIQVEVHAQPLPAPHTDAATLAAIKSASSATTAAAQLKQAPSLADISVLTAPLFDAYGTTWQGQSVQGRSIAATYKRGSDQPVLLSGGQHANEISGVTGGIRAAYALAAMPDSHFAYIPLENPDGYALHQRYISGAPAQMHHAARYTALGDDLEYRDHAPWYEAAVRRDALAQTGAQLHLSLHGYPAHEWTRPLTGYIPQGFDLWSIPKGFFLILRFHEAWEDKAMALINAVTQGLQQVPGLADYTARQLALYQRHSGRQPFALLNGTPCSISANANGLAPVTLITEFPDETVNGDALHFAHSVQSATVQLAYQAWQQIMQK